MWNFRIIKKGESYGLYEVIYNDDGKISAHDEDPTIVGESVDDLLEYLNMMVSDANKCKDEILEYGKIKFAPLYEGEQRKELGDLLEDFLNNANVFNDEEGEEEKN